MALFIVVIITLTALTALRWNRMSDGLKGALSFAWPISALIAIFGTLFWFYNKHLSLPDPPIRFLDTILFSAIVTFMIFGAVGISLGLAERLAIRLGWTEEFPLNGTLLTAAGLFVGVLGLLITTFSA